MAERGIILDHEAFANVNYPNIAVALGSTLSNHIDPKLLSNVAGAGFIAIGLWTVWQA